MLLFNRLVFSAGLVCASASAALACAGQSGKVIFSDDFKDDSGGWDVGKHAFYIPEVCRSPLTRTNWVLSP
jgi:hypothetical protein